jgi:hypothetical protein
MSMAADDAAIYSFGSSSSECGRELGDGETSDLGGGDEAAAATSWAPMQARRASGPAAGRSGRGGGDADFCRKPPKCIVINNRDPNIYTNPPKSDRN